MSRNDLDEIVKQYKTKLQNVDQNSNIELEIRYKNIDRSTFVTIYEYLIQIIDPSNIKLIQTYNALMHDNKTNITYIYERKFEDDKFDIGQNNSKNTITIPYKDPNMYYNVVLSLEKQNIPKFLINNSCTIRIKNRVSFTVTLDDLNEVVGNKVVSNKVVSNKVVSNEDKIKWKIDMTILKSLSGPSINNLEKIVKHMFRDNKVTPANILSVFKEELHIIHNYQYEIEIELINSEKVKSNDIIEIAKRILLIANPHYTSDFVLQSKLETILNLFNKNRTKKNNYTKLSINKILPKVISLTRSDYKLIYPLIGYFITDKADGLRAIGCVEKEAAYILTDTLKTINYTSTEHQFKSTIVDAELINDTLYIFDIIQYNDINVSSHPFEERYIYLDKAATELNKAGIKAVVKEYVQVLGGDLEQYIKKIYNKKRPYDIDGLIFVAPHAPYQTTKSYKWKKLEDNTIDFLVKKVPKSLLGKEPYITKDGYTMYFLFVGISYDMYRSLNMNLCHNYDEIFNNMKASKTNYFPIQFCPSNAPLAYIYYHPDSSILNNIDNSVVEFRCIDNCTTSNGPLITWQPVRIRNDKKKDLEHETYFGNDFRIAEMTWINYLDPFPLEQLWLNDTNEYFMEEKSDIYRSQITVLSIVKDNRIMSYKHSNWILDIGTGKGQDLARYFRAGVKNLIALDSNKASLSELIRRKFSLVSTDYVNKDSHIKKETFSTNVYVLLANMVESYILNLTKLYNTIRIPNNFIDSIICNLSVHYYIYTPELLQNFISFVDNLIKDNGHLVLTCFFGEEVFNLLKNLKQGDTWLLSEQGVVKYSIKKLYSSNKLEDNGQQISVLLPFSKGKYYEEYLVNTRYLEKELNKHGYKLVLKQKISDIIPDIKLKHVSLYSSLTENDLTYLSLYGELIFQKVKMNK
jgi:hypothetical protein